MPTIKTFLQVSACCAAVFVASPARAGQSSAPQPSDPAKPQVQTFEMVLKAAVESGGQNFARQAARMSPDIAALSFSPGESPVVSGIADHDLGLYVFQVQVPGVSLTLQVMNLMLNRPQAPFTRPSGATPVSNGRVGADAAVIPSDPMDPTAARPDLERVYRNEVRDALIDAILDNSGGLPLGGKDTLLVYASGIDPSVGNTLMRGPSNKLVLKASGADLAAFRQGTITRDEARQRIRVASF